MLSITQRGLRISLVVIALLLASAIVPCAGAVTYTYDDLNRLARVEYADGTIIEYSYDSAGNRLQRTVQAVDTTPPTTTAAPAGGTYNAPQSVTLTCNDGTGSGCAKTYYTTDGSTPTTSSSVYGPAIAISSTTTLKFFSGDLAGNKESVKSQTYTILTGDLDGDGKVDCADLSIVKTSFGKKCGQSGFDARADLNKDCLVDVRDLAIVSKQVPVGTRCP